MQTLEGLRKTIETATDLESVVKTMKTLAAVRIRQYEKAVEALDDYNLTIELGFQVLLRGTPGFANVTQKSKGPTGVIVFGTDQGMCGQFNEEIVSFLNSNFDLSRFGYRLSVVGSRVKGYMEDSQWKAEKVYSVPTSASEITDLIQELLPQVQQWQADQGLSRLLVFHNQRTTASSFQPRQIQVLPIGSDQFEKWSDTKWNSRSLPMYTMDHGQLLSFVIRQYLFVSLFRACAESLSSENASRIAAMESAGKNIEQRLEELNDSFNRLRQQSITEELLDVVSGFEAMSKERKDRIAKAFHSQ